MGAAMECSGCGHVNREGAAFCGACGLSLARELVCPACATANPAGQRFCDACGQSLGDAAAGASGPGSGGTARTLATPSGVAPAAAPPDAPKALGDGRYVVRGFLGEGAKKRVYLARYTRLNRDVALALISRTKSSTRAVGRGCSARPKPWASSATTPTS
jgi:hypothetical protein